MKNHIKISAICFGLATLATFCLSRESMNPYPVVNEIETQKEVYQTNSILGDVKGKTSEVLVKQESSIDSKFFLKNKIDGLSKASKPKKKDVKA